MSRPVQKRYPARNPFGDKSIQTLVWSEGEDLVIPYDLDAYSYTSFAMDLETESSGVPAQMGQSPGFVQLARLFTNYRVYKCTTVTTFTNMTSEPVLVWHQPYTVSTETPNVTPLPNVTNIPEQRWTKSRMLAPAGSTGSQCKIVSSYNPYKIAFFDKASTSQAYGNVLTIDPGVTVGPISYANDRPWMRYGISTYDGNIPTSPAINPRVVYHTKVYLKVQWFDRLNLVE